MTIDQRLTIASAIERALRCEQMHQNLDAELVRRNERRREIERERGSHLLPPACRRRPVPRRKNSVAGTNHGRVLSNRRRESTQAATAVDAARKGFDHGIGK